MRRSNLLLHPRHLHCHTFSLFFFFLFFFTLATRVRANDYFSIDSFDGEGRPFHETILIYNDARSIAKINEPMRYIQRNLHDNFEFRRCVITSLMDRGLISFVISCGRFLKEEMINYCFSLRNNNLFFFNHWEIKYWRMKSSIMKNIVIEIITHRNIKIKEY